MKPVSKISVPSSDLHNFPNTVQRGNPQASKMILDELMYVITKKERSHESRSREGKYTSFSCKHCSTPVDKLIILNKNKEKSMF